MCTNLGKPLCPPHRFRPVRVPQGQSPGAHALSPPPNLLDAADAFRRHGRQHVRGRPAGLAPLAERRERYRPAPAGALRPDAGPAHRPLPHPARGAGTGRPAARRTHAPPRPPGGGSPEPQAGAGQRRQPVLHADAARPARPGRGRQQLAHGHQQRRCGLQLQALCATGAGPGQRQLLRHRRDHGRARLLSVAGDPRRPGPNARAGSHQDRAAGAGARMAADARHRAGIGRARRGVPRQPGRLALPPANPFGRWTTAPRTGWTTAACWPASARRT